LRADSKLVIPTLEEATSLSAETAELTYGLLLKASMGFLPVTYSKSLASLESPKLTAQEIAMLLAESITSGVPEQVAQQVAQQIVENATGKVEVEEVVAQKTKPLPAMKPSLPRHFIH
jgi:hypothetical protein